MNKNIHVQGFPFHYTCYTERTYSDYHCKNHTPSFISKGFGSLLSVDKKHNIDRVYIVGNMIHSIEDILRNGYKSKEENNTVIHPGKEKDDFRKLHYLRKDDNVIINIYSSRRSKYEFNDHYDIVTEKEQLMVHVPDSEAIELIDHLSLYYRAAFLSLLKTILDINPLEDAV